MNEAGKCRVMGELVVLDGIGAAEAIGFKLKAAGFEFVITDDEDDDERPTAWLDRLRLRGPNGAANATSSRLSRPLLSTRWAHF